MENRCVCCGEIIPEGGHYCPNCGKKKIVGEKEKRRKKREEFLDCLVTIADYWKDKEDASFGAIFSFLVMCDGDSSVNDFNTVEIKGISDSGVYMHEEFCERRNKYEKENKQV